MEASPIRFKPYKFNTSRYKSKPLIVGKVCEEGRWVIKLSLHIWDKYTDPDSYH